MVSKLDEFPKIPQSGCLCNSHTTVILRLAVSDVNKRWFSPREDETELGHSTRSGYLLVCFICAEILNLRILTNFWISSSIFRPQHFSKLIQTRNEAVFRPSGPQNQMHRTKMWFPNAVLSISAHIKTYLATLYRILWPNSVSALRKKKPFVDS
jgi:hypothetical protein